jgi:hypothetical protein
MEKKRNEKDTEDKRKHIKDKRDQALKSMMKNFKEH